MCSQLKRFCTCISLAIVLSTGWSQSMPESGVVRYNISSPVSEDSSRGSMLLHFLPGKGAGILGAVKGTETIMPYRSVYDFDRDSVYNVLQSEEETIVTAFRISELFRTDGTKQFTLIEYPDSTILLGYACSRFTASNTDSSFLIEGWTTTGIRTKTRPIMEKVFQDTGFPLAFEVKVKTPEGFQHISYLATEIGNIPDEKQFVLPRTTIRAPAPPVKAPALAMDTRAGWEIKAAGEKFLIAININLQANLSINPYQGGAPYLILKENVTGRKFDKPYPEKFKRILTSAIRGSREEGTDTVLEPVSCQGSMAYQYKLCSKNLNLSRNCRLIRLFMMGNQPYELIITSTVANFDACLTSALPMLETLTIIR